MQNNENFNNQPNISNIPPVYLLLGGMAMIIVNYFLYISGSVYFLLIIITPMAILLGLFGLIAPNKSKSYNIQVLISIISIIIGITIFYFLVD